MEEKQNKRKNKRIKKFKQLKVLYFSIFIFMSLILSISIFSGIKKFLENRIDKDRIRIVVKDNIVSDDLAIYTINNENYFSVEFLKKYIDSTLFPEQDKDTITITNTNNVIRLNTDELTYYVNSNPISLELPIIVENNIMLMPVSLAKSIYNLDINYINNNKKAIIDFNNENKKTTKLHKTVKIYDSTDKKNKKVAKLKKNTEITIFDKENGYYSVRGSNGEVGYLKEKYIKQINEEITKNNNDNNDNRVAFKPKNGRITMIWDQVFNSAQNKKESKYIPIDNLDVISPTWFEISDDEGNVSNIADKSYIDWAHSKGYQVWGLFSNGFDPDITHNTLSNPDIREKIIKQILSYAQIYNLDGINIDFEAIRKADGEYFVQFVREITPYLKAQGLTVSVDLSRPEGWNSYYGMKEVGEVVDYVVLMAYDEHWGTSPKSGSVASIGWTEQSIINSLKMVPKEKLILGVPFYTRLWEEKIVDNKNTVSSSSLGMKSTLEYISKNGMQTVYDNESGQNYASIEKNDITYKIWIEDDLSMRKRMELIEKYDIAGVAGWKRHLEGENTLNIINEYMKN